MESFLPSEIARLVLGYLEDEKSEEAYNTFLKTSLHLKECLNMKENGRKFRTQVLGLSLLDILYEYSAIYSLVQERLKKADPEASDRLKNSGTLLDKITFLLNATGSGQTMLFSITLPPGKSPQTSKVAHVRKRLRTSSSSEKKDKSIKKNPNQSEEIPTSVNRADECVNLETTSLSSLPGNLKQKCSINAKVENVDNDINKAPKRKYSTLQLRRSRSSASIPEEPEENLDFTVLTQALLDNHELHEKIAENINKVICTPELSNTNNSTVHVTENNTSCIEPETSVCSTNNFTMELDNVIKKIVDQTESDPIFENFLQDVVGPVSHQETSDECDDKIISNTSTPCQPTPETIKKNPSRRFRNSRLKGNFSPIANSSDTNSPSKIDNQNAAIIEDIISINSKEIQNIAETPSEPIITANQPQSENIVSELVNPVENSQVSQISVNAAETFNNNEVITSAFNELQNLPSNRLNELYAATAESLSNSDTIEQSKIIIENQSTIQQPTYVISDQYQPVYQQAIVPDNRIILLNKFGGATPQIVTMQPTIQFTQPATVLSSDGGLITMPMIMCDDATNSAGYFLKNQTKYALPKTTKNPIEPVKILPKLKVIPKINNLQNIAPSKSNQKASTQHTDGIKYIININPHSEDTVIKSTENSTALNISATDTVTTLVNTTTVPTMPIIISSTCETISGETKSTDEVVPVEVKSVPVIGAELSTKKGKSLPMISLNSSKKDSQLEKIVTPEKHTICTRRSMSSPRSNRSHIRALDFSTPAKEKIPLRKINSSPIRKSSDRASKSPMKQLRSSVFLSPVLPPNIPIATISPKQTKLQGDWSGTDLIFGKNDSPQKDTSGNILFDSYENQRKSRPMRAAAARSQYFIKSMEKSDISLSTSSEKVDSDSSDSKNKKKLNSWDQDLRALVETEFVRRPVVPKKKKTPKKAVKRGQTNKKKSKVLNSTDDDGWSIERALAEMEGNVISEEKTNQDKDKNKVEKPVPKQKKTPGRKRKNTKKENLAITDTKPKQENDTKVIEENVSQIKPESVPSPTERLRNMKPRVKKKCNIVKKSTVLQDEVNKGKSTELTRAEENSEEVLSKLMQSSKREVNITEGSKENDPVILISLEKFPAENIQTCDENSEIALNKITSGINKDMINNSVATKLNVTPNLETPVKCNSLMLPITPRLFTPLSNMGSPFSKLFNEKINSVDITNIFTPGFPITPNLPKNLLGGNTMSPYASRPTDYSNSSSYYQPSDSEQSQKLEQVLIEEAMKIETSQRATSTPTKFDISKSSSDTLTTTKSSLNSSHNNSTTSLSSSTTISDSSCLFVDLNEKEVEATVIYVPQEKLRANKSNDKKNEHTNTVTQDNKKNTKEIMHFVENEKSNVKKSHAKFLELAVKRKRPISELEQETAKPNKPQGKKEKEIKKGIKNINPFKAVRSNVIITRAKSKLNNEEPKLKGSRKSSSPKLGKNKVAHKSRKKKNLPYKSPDSCSVKNHFFDEDEEIPRLHLSSDEEDDHLTLMDIQMKDSDMLVKGLNLIPKKQLQNKDQKPIKLPNYKNNNFNNKKEQIIIESDIHLSKSQIIDVSQFSQGFATNIISPSNPVETSKNPNEIIPAIMDFSKDKKQTENKPTSNDENLSADLNSCDTEYEVTCITENSSEYIKIIYDETNKTKKNISDYDLNLLGRNISANVFIEELNAWQDTKLTVTPFEDVLSMPSKRVKKVTVSAKDKKTKKEQSCTIKPLDILYNELIDDSSADTFSPKKIKSQKTEPEVKSKISNRHIKSVNIDINRGKLKPKVGESFNASIDKSRTDAVENAKLTDDEDMLMDFALTGNEKSLDLANKEEITMKKRKATDDIVKQATDKRVKANKHALLRTLDVDSFLTKVHGPSDKS